MAGSLGSLSVRIEAKAQNAKMAFTSILNQAQRTAKGLGNMKVGEGSLFSKDGVKKIIGAARQHFEAMISDIHDVSSAARDAGKSVTEFTKGLFTDEDVRRATEFSLAAKRISDVFKSGRKDILIDISPLVSTSLEFAAKILDANFIFLDRLQGFGLGIGEIIGNKIAPRQSGPAGSNAVENVGADPLVDALKRLVENPFDKTEERRAATKLAEEQRLLMLRIAIATEAEAKAAANNTGQTVTLSEGNIK